jgi:hypothetical protein
MILQQKYLKYKEKYLKLKQEIYEYQTGGDDIDDNNIIHDFILLLDKLLSQFDIYIKKYDNKNDYNDNEIKKSGYSLIEVFNKFKSSIDIRNKNPSKISNIIANLRTIIFDENIEKRMILEDKKKRKWMCKHGKSHMLDFSD